MLAPNDEAEKINAEGLVEDLKTYTNTRLKLLGLEATKRGADIFSGLISIFLIIFILFLIILFLSLAASAYISSLLENKSAGFLIVAGFYFLTAILLWLGRKKLLVHPIREKLIRIIFNTT